MGVYVFKCLHGPYVKVGHHLVARGRPNAYYRVAGRGFETIIHPEELNGLLYIQHLSLEAWYPKLTREEEKMVHKTFTTGKIGEFHRLEDLDGILSYLDGVGSRTALTEDARKKAIRWGFRQVKKARRRKKKAVT
ncbi:MAG: hypothetical protein CBC65_001700 [Rhodothermaceae bacterium TMED105]|jgi:hypothetical protein|nr:MAG: hypothetical protein CBC65_001700 [Rhodothermaceae bacterium TMED105]|tara:strand:- start:11634 stop:12038 length:405 start_codon:yes stop_codon:yes gene_type:complete